MTAALRLSELAAEYWEFRLRENPSLAHELGDTRYRRELFRESTADYARRDRAAAGFLERLVAIPEAEFQGQDRFSYLLLERELRETREQFALRSHWRPQLFPRGPEGQAAYACEKVVISNRADAEDFLARMETVPSLFEAHRERLWEGVKAGYRLPRVLLDRIGGAVESYLVAAAEQSVWYKPLERAKAVGEEKHAAVGVALRKLIEEHIRPAYQSWADMLRNDYAPHCRDSIGTREEPDGEEYYAFLARHYTTTELSPAEIHAIGRKEVIRIRAEMQTVAAAAGFSGDLAGLKHFLNADPRFVAGSKQELRERIEILAKRIERRIPEFFGRIPRMTYGVESIPEALAAQLPPAYAQPNPASAVTSGVYWVTSLPQRCPSFMHAALTLHEAWPGHLMHIALLQEMSELPAFQRYGVHNYTAYVEGWAMYCERLGHEFGLYQDPFALYGRLDMEIWRAVRLVVDTGIHVMGWTREQAIAYMAEHLTLARATIEAEVDRYIGMPAQALAYKIGELKFRELRERASCKFGERFSLRALHDRFSNAGPVTLDLLDEHVQTWIENSHAAAA